MTSEQSWWGIGAAPGHAVGAAFVLRYEDMRDVPAGCILVARILHPHLAPLFMRISGVVVEEGALLQHATTLAREFGIPAVVGLQGATNIFRNGEWLELHGDTGQVTRRELDDP